MIRIVFFDAYALELNVYTWVIALAIFILVRRRRIEIVEVERKPTIDEIQREISASWGEEVREAFNRVIIEKYNRPVQHPDVDQLVTIKPDDPEDDKYVFSIALGGKVLTRENTHGQALNNIKTTTNDRQKIDAKPDTGE